MPPWNRASPDSAFLQAARDGRVPAESWTHRRFLRLAFLVLREQGLSDAFGHLTTLREGLPRTATHAWVQVLAGAGAQFYQGDFRDFLADHPSFIDPGYLRRHFSAARLASPEARDEVLPTDRDDLPRPGALLPDAPGAPGFWEDLWAWLRGRPAARATPRPLRLAITSGPATACPFCADPMDQGPIVACRRCDTLHHHDCWRAAQGCTTFGCGAGPEDRVRRPA